MNRGIYCAVGVATGVFLLGGGVAQAAPTTHEADRHVDDIRRNTESLSPNGIKQTPADRAELLDGLGGAKLGGVDLLGTLLNGITTGGLLGNLTGEGGGPLGALLGGGPLGALTGAKPAPANGADAAATRGNVVGEAPVSSSSSSEGLEERQPVSGTNPLAGGTLFGPNGPLGQVEILGGDTLAGLPIAGDLLAGGLSLGTIDTLPALTDVVDQVSGEDGGGTLPALGSLPTIGGLTRMLLGGESAERVAGATEHATEHRVLTQRTIDKAKVTPQLQELSGIVHQLPPAG